MVKKLCIGIFLVIGILFSGVIGIFLFNTQVIESENPTDVAPPKTTFILSNGEQIAYSEINNNSSTTVIFVGGLSAWNGTWDRTIQALNKSLPHLNYIAIDLPPFGYSIPGNGSSYFRDAQAERIASFIKNKGITQVILVGHSYGAGPVTEYALRYETTVKKLIIIDGVLNIDEEKHIDTENLAHIDLLRDVLLGVLVHNDTFALSRLKTFVYVTTHIDQELLDTYTRYFNTKNTTERLSSWFLDYMDDPLTYQSNRSENYKTIHFPVRLIWGDKDTITPIEGTDILIRTVPDVVLITLQDIGHIPMIEDLNRFDEALLEAVSQ